MPEDFEDADLVFANCSGLHRRIVLLWPVGNLADFVMRRRDAPSPNTSVSSGITQGGLHKVDGDVILIFATN